MTTALDTDAWDEVDPELEARLRRLPWPRASESVRKRCLATIAARIAEVPGGGLPQGPRRAWGL